MTKIKNKILVIDDDESFRETVKLCFSDDNFVWLTASNGEDGLRLFVQDTPDLVITDYLMPNLNGCEVLRQIKSLDKDIPVIMLTAIDAAETIVDAMKLGADDVLFKPIHVDKFREKVLLALSEKTLHPNESMIIEGSIDKYKSGKELIGKTQAMREIIKVIGSIASNRTNVLIEGDNGTGKEVIARAIHASGITSVYPFVGVNCSALSPSLLESELFGHDKGSFTGAFRVKKGKLELAGQGTLFLDEVSEMSMEMQVKLLRVLQEREFERVGGEESIPLQARVIAATNRNLPQLVHKNKFRADLFHRLNIIHIKIPPLRERKEDIPSLVIALLSRINRELDKRVKIIPYPVIEFLKEQQWPGNVRELENTLRRAVVLTKTDRIEMEHIILDDEIQDTPPQSKLLTLAESEKQHIEFTLKVLKWNKHKACEILDITKPTLLKKIKEYNLHPPDQE